MVATASRVEQQEKTALIKLTSVIQLGLYPCRFNWFSIKLICLGAMIHGRYQQRAFFADFSNRNLLAAP